MIPNWSKSRIKSKKKALRASRLKCYWDLNPTPNAQGFAPEEEYQEACRLNDRYCLFNRLFRASVVAYWLFPKTTKRLRRMYSHNNPGSRIKDL